MVKVSLLSEDGVDEGACVSDEGNGFSGLDLLEITQKSTIIDLYFDNDCVSVVPPYLVEVK